MTDNAAISHDRSVAAGGADRAEPRRGWRARIAAAVPMPWRRSSGAGALRKLFNTTAFKLTLAYLTIFALFAACLLGYFAWNTRRLITEEITRVVDIEMTGLVEQYNQGGIRRLVLIIDARARRPGSSLYLVTTFTGDGLAGNVGLLGEGVLDHSGWTETVYRRLDDPEGNEQHALVRVFQLPSGFRLLVGRDLAERERLFAVIVAAGQWSIALVIVLGLTGGFVVARRVLRRVDAMTETARTIMAGDLSGRLPAAGSGDELDRLAVNLNAMLERIEALMRGFREVSDNIAHDLKTPLTRLRNRTEEALRTAKTEPDYRDALEATLEESDELIKTFNALLTIARTESGQASTPTAVFDAAEVARGVAELYDPLAEEKGLSLAVDAPAAVSMRGNRELLTQALANLIDNAIKYGVPAKAGDAPAISVSVRADGDRVVLEVADRGRGIAAQDRNRAVERFVRLEQSRSEPGSGLGLSLAAAVAHLHGGALELGDNGPGLKARLVLPAGNPRLPQPVEPA